MGRVQKQVIVGFHASPEWVERVKTRAAEHGLAYTAWIKHAVDLALDDGPPEPHCWVCGIRLPVLPGDGSAELWLNRFCSEQCRKHWRQYLDRTFSALTR